MKDFVGREIQPQDFLVKGGKGNGAGEYGMILHRALTLADGSVRTARLSIKYDHSTGVSVSTVRIKQTTISNLNTVMVVTPPKHVVELFERAEAKTLTDADKDTIGNWLHGSSHQKPWG